MLGFTLRRCTAATEATTVYRGGSVSRPKRQHTETVAIETEAAAYRDPGGSVPRPTHLRIETKAAAYRGCGGNVSRPKRQLLKPRQQRFDTKVAAYRDRGGSVSRPKRQLRRSCGRSHCPRNRFRRHSRRCYHHRPHRPACRRRSHCRHHALLAIAVTPTASPSSGSVAARAPATTSAATPANASVSLKKL